jgi:hypothetical protein
LPATSVAFITSLTSPGRAGTGSDSPSACQNAAAPSRPTAVAPHGWVQPTVECQAVAGWATTATASHRMLELASTSSATPHRRDIKRGANFREMRVLLMSRGDGL